MSSNPQPKAIAVVGPTAVGKTAVAVALAQRLQTEIISADSRQIYCHMDIGTAKPTVEERGTVRHHLIDIIDPDQTYSAGTYVRDVQKVLKERQDMDLPPLIVGGAGLYVRALTGGLFEGPQIPGQVLERIRKDFEGKKTNELHDRLNTVDPAAAARIHLNDRQRIGRALEVYEATGTALTTWHRNASPNPSLLNLHIIGLQRDRAELYARADARVDSMMSLGLVNEVRMLLDMGYTAETAALSTFGYAEIIAYLQGDLPLDEAVGLIKQQTRRYAKRQITWFRHTDRISWLTLSHEPDIDRVCDEIMASLV